MPSTSTGIRFIDDCPPFSIEAANKSLKMEYLQGHINDIKRKINICKAREKIYRTEKEDIFREYLLGNPGDLLCPCAYCQTYGMTPEERSEACDLKRCEFSCSKCKVHLYLDTNNVVETRCCANWRSTFSVKYKPLSKEFDITSEDNYRRLKCPLCKKSYYTTKKRDGDQEDSFAVHYKKCKDAYIHQNITRIKRGKKIRRQCLNCNLVFREIRDVDMHECDKLIYCSKGCGTSFKLYTLMLRHVKFSRCK